MKTQAETLELIAFNLRRGMWEGVAIKRWGLDLVNRARGIHVEPRARNFGERLATSRRNSNLTIDELARALRLRSDHIQAYEEGVRLPASPNIIGKLASFLGEDVDVLHKELSEAA